MTTAAQLDDQAGIINSLQARIRQLEGQLQFQANDQAQAVVCAAESAIRRLRLFGVILLQLEDGGDELQRELSENPLIAAAYNQAWKLENAPVEPEVKSAIRKAAHNGSNRW